jgi:DNA-binding HxlR family transcriptional regulator
MHQKSRQTGQDTAWQDLFDVLGRRWTLRLLWEMDDAGLTYRELAARIPEMSTAMLTQRLRELRTAGQVEHVRGAGYRLTPLGHELRSHLERLREWARQVGFAADASG